MVPLVCTLVKLFLFPWHGAYGLRMCRYVLWEAVTVIVDMQGTAITEAEEFYNVYKLNVVQVPSRLPNQRIDHEPVLFVDFATKLINIYVMATQAHSRQRPVLIGTSSVEESEAIQQVLEGKMWPKMDPIMPWEVWTKLDMLRGLRSIARERWASRKTLL